MRPLRFVFLGLAACTALACADDPRGAASAERGDRADYDEPSSLAQEATPGAPPASEPGAASGPCDRACLLGFVQIYLDALVAKDFERLPVASSLKYTENGRVIQPGEGLFRTASALVPRARLDFGDPTTGNVATQVVVNENGSTPVIYMARLKIVNRQIAEIEAMSVRRQGAANGFFNPARMVPEPVFLAPVPASGRMTREQLNAITEQYLDYLEGKRRPQQVPFANTCKRYENGQVTASGLSSFNAQTFWRFAVTRRTLIIDEEAGITWGMYPFSQSASALVVGEAFKIVGGKIEMIQAVMANQPTRAWN